MANQYGRPDNLKPYESARRLSILKKTKEVLIIDDQSTGRTILEKIIQQIGDNIHVTALGNPSVALEWLDHHEVDLIVTDYRMPEIDGIEFIRRVRQIPALQSVPIMMITVVSEKAVRYDALDAGATAFLTRPIDQIECRTSCRNLLQMHEQHLIIEDRANWLARQVEIATEQIILREKETIIRLAKAGEYRDEGTGNHVIRMAKYSRFIAEALGVFDEQQCEDLEYAAPMHDIGKIGIPDSVLLKPGKLDPDEWEIMKTHTTIGHEILSDSQSKYMHIGAVIALHHHERYDGKGYPNQLKGEDIPLIARVVAVADIYDALVSERPYKKAWSNEDACRYIEQSAGTQLDPRCVQAFFDRIDAIQQIQAEYAD
ncbi:MULTISPECIES: HD domain-containing phosphohydrolase [unclassified Methylophaga]|uniref:HD domain-containing phosphohydrolase n=1 Tax=unclassified Methylophaga TaxID=2629249 RepID=UPI000C98A10F|nr:MULTISPECIES: HD domain-containing phosphohydrolase [unclassified Methylophaga]MAK68071.1 two-component system response regulator [Methylophaga sp.]MAY16846.1 two-component system response regulator [Methylophaga sp.]HCD04515.1 two-component system response regulator [Methylophaga sp.]